MLVHWNAGSHPMSSNQERVIITTLQQGDLSVQGEFLWGSNYTFLVQIERGEYTLRAVYKPTRGERPLWDFPAASLARREVAAYLVSQALSWEFVPPTVYRREGPLGPGSVQLFVEHDPEYHYFNFSEADHQRMRPVVLFDLLINNADRKGSHVLIGADGHIWLIDHGISFHVEDKLRTVIWDFAGETIPEELGSDIHQLRQKLSPNEDEPSELTSLLGHYLSQREIAALAHRADRFLATARFPHPHPERRTLPWPPV